MLVVLCGKLWLRLSIETCQIPFSKIIFQELLKVLHGSPLDHTILLASYFLHLGLKCYVATGFGLPRGISHYVLTKYDLNTHRTVLTNDQCRSKSLFSRSDGSVWYVYDAVIGEKFELRDVSCPLKSVEYVFDNENVSVWCESYI